MTDCNEITPLELWEALHSPSPPVLVDVRELYEHESFHIGGYCIPLGELNTRWQEIPEGANVVFYCQKGVRSAIAIQRLQARASGRFRMLNLAGGMHAWRNTLGARTSGTSVS